MYFNLGIRPVNCNKDPTSTCIPIWAFDLSTAILMQQVHVHVFQFEHLTGQPQ